MNNLIKNCWPSSQLDRALLSLTQKTGYVSSNSRINLRPITAKTNVDSWIGMSVTQLNLEVKNVDVSYEALPSLLPTSAPAIICVNDEKTEHYLIVLEASEKYLTVLSPDESTGKIEKISIEHVYKYLRTPIEAAHTDEIKTVVNHAGISPKYYDKTVNSLLSDRIAHISAAKCWILIFPTSQPFIQQLKHKKLHFQLSYLIAAHIGQYSLMLIGWWLLGSAVLSGRIEVAWIIAWGLLLITEIPIQLYSSYLQGIFAIEVGYLIKQRLMFGALLLNPDTLKQEGSGEVLSKVIDAESIESVATDGGLLSLLSIFEGVMAVIILSMGAGGWLHVALFIIFLLVLSVVIRNQFQYRQSWTQSRLSMTNDLIEKMTGHRTRLIQQDPADWHNEEDNQLQAYVALSQQMDRSMSKLISIAPRLWLCLGFVGLLPAFFNPTNNSALLAISVGGLLLTYRALLKGLGAYDNLATVIISWQRISKIFNNKNEEFTAKVHIDTHALRIQNSRKRSPDGLDKNAIKRVVLLNIDSATFGYKTGAPAALVNCNLAINYGDKILLQGESGSGKSTLAALLSGINTPQRGTMLLHGLDIFTLGHSYWRKKVVISPQFNDNHIITETFLFNLLMGQHWPPTMTIIQEAHEICNELGLSSLVNKMPGGMMQIIGETGWQLSHGEKSRLFIARVLLQKADLIVLDENFGALDPETMKMSIECVMNRAPSLLIIAHP